MYNENIKIGDRVKIIDPGLNFPVDFGYYWSNIRRRVYIGVTGIVVQIDSITDHLPYGVKTDDSELVWCHIVEKFKFYDLPEELFTL